MEEGTKTEKKQAKQKRKHHHARWIGETKKAGKSRFHIPKNVYRTNELRCIRRKEYRAYMRSRVSELRKKEEARWLKANPTLPARQMHKDKKWSKKT